MCDMMEEGILVLKPDAALSQRVRRLAYQFIREEGLVVRSEYIHQFSREDVFDTWPKFASPKYPITGRLMVHYMTSGPSRVYIVAGPAALAACIRVRERFRASWGTAAMSNGMHTPTEPDELLPSWSKFARSIPEQLPHIRHVDEGTTPGIFGGLSELSQSELDSAIDAAWRAQSESERPRHVVQKGVGGSILDLLPGDPNSIDFGISAIVETLPALSPVEAICAYLRSEKLGRASLAKGHRSEIEMLFEKLASQNMLVELVE